MKMADQYEVEYSMKTLYQFAMNFEKRSHKVVSHVFKKSEPELKGFVFRDNNYRNKLIDSLKLRGRGKYRFELNYKNILNDTVYTLKKLKNVIINTAMKLKNIQFSYSFFMFLLFCIRSFN